MEHIRSVVWTVYVQVWRLHEAVAVSAVYVNVWRLQEFVVDGSRVFIMQTVEHRRRFAWVLGLLVVLPVTTLAAFVAGILLYPRYGGEARVQALMAMDGCAQSVQIYDQRGWVGRTPLSMYSRPDPCQEAKKAGWEPHETSYLADVPILFRRMLIAAEDRRHGKYWLLNIRGVDIPGLADAAFRVVRGDTSRGASTPSMQMTRMLRGNAPGEKSFWDKLRRKPTEFLDAISLTPAIGGAGSEELFRWASRNLPCAQGTASSEIGGTVYGLVGCARVLFNKDVPELSVAEMALIISANKHPVLFAPQHHKKEQDKARKRRKEVIDRALRVIDWTFENRDPSVADAAKAEIRAMKLAEPRLPQRYLRLLRNDPKTRLEVGGNSGKRITKFAYGETIQAQGELSDAFGKELPADLIGLRLTIDDLAVNKEFKNEVDRILSNEQRRRRGQLKLRLTQDSASTTLKRADVHLSLADSRGRVVRHYSWTDDTVWAGSESKRDENGRYRLENEDRHLGSTVKALAALALGAQFRASDAFCNQWLDGLRNPGGSRGFRSCQSPAAWTGVPEVFGKSLSLAVGWALRRIPDHELELRALVTAAGLGLPHADVTPRVALSMGMVSGTPRHLHRLYAALLRGALSRPAKAGLPTLIDQIDWRAEDGSLRHLQFDAVRERGEIDLSTWFSSPRIGNFLLSVLAAPARSGGTLAGLDSIVRRVGGRHLIAKSGTTVIGKKTDKKKIRDNWVAGAFLGPDGNVLTFVLLAGAPDPRYPLANSGGVSRTAKLRLIEAMLESFYSDVAVR